MQIQEVINGVRDALTVRRVFSEPIERDGVTIIEAAAVRGGAGGGESAEGAAEGKPAGLGTGFGLHAKPIGVYVIKGDKVRYRPAVDLNRIIMGGQIVAALAFITLRAIVKARMRSARFLTHHARHAMRA
jgi:uncharacterized spore protein YtfJ